MKHSLSFTPASGELDLARVRAWLDARPDAFEDPCGTGAYVVAGHPAMADLLHDKRIEDPSRFPRGIVVHLAPAQVRFNQELGDRHQLRSVMDLAGWLIASFDVHVHADGEDVTATVRAHGVAALYDPDTVAAPLPWAGALIDVGFFWEIDVGERSGHVSLERARRDGPQPDEDRIVEYLRWGRFHARTETVARDPLDDDRPWLGPVELVTDGVYVWPSELPYFVHRYHARLPRHFVIHARASGWAVPGGREPRMPLPSFTAPWSTLILDEARVVLGKRARTGTGDEVRDGYLITDPDRRVLVTLASGFTESKDSLQERLAMDVPGIAPMRWLDKLPDDGIPYDIAVVEDVPAGRPALERAPLPEAAAIRIGASLAHLLVDAQAAGIAGVGTAPELVYVDRALGFAGLVPRGRLLIASSRQPRGGLRSYPIPYESYETLILGQPPSAASDVCSLCMTLHVLATGNHPFGPMTGELGTIVNRMMRDDRDAYPGSPALGALLARGMARDPAQRPSAAELEAALSSLAGTTA